MLSLLNYHCFCYNFIIINIPLLLLLLLLLSQYYCVENLLACRWMILDALMYWCTGIHSNTWMKITICFCEFSTAEILQIQRLQIYNISFRATSIFPHNHDQEQDKSRFISQLSPLFFLKRGYVGVVLPYMLLNALQCGGSITSWGDQWWHS